MIILFRLFYTEELQVACFSVFYLSFSFSCFFELHKHNDEQSEKHLITG